MPNTQRRWWTRRLRWPLRGPCFPLTRRQLSDCLALLRRCSMSCPVPSYSQFTPFTALCSGPVPAYSSFPVGSDDRRRDPLGLPLTLAADLNCPDRKWPPQVMLRDSGAPVQLREAVTPRWARPSPLSPELWVHGVRAPFWRPSKAAKRSDNWVLRNSSPRPSHLSPR